MAKLYFYYSSMNAGKSTMLLQSSHNYQECGMDTLLFTPTIDTRFGFGKIASRIGIESKAVPFGLEFDLFACAEKAVANNSNIRCVLLDEAQFLTKPQVYQLTEITDQLHMPVLSYGLRTDFRGEPFAGSLYLLAWADELIEIKTICHCGRKATMVMRVDDGGVPIKEGAQIAIGGNERYVSTCRKHHKLGETMAINRSSL